MAMKTLAQLSSEMKERFWSKVDTSVPADCWEWTAARNFYGYGVINFGKKGGVVLATHVSLILDGRPRPDGKLALHACDNRGCVNPNHLRWGTHRENTQDMMQRDRFISTERLSAIMLARAARGERSSGAKLTADQVRSIRADNRTFREIAQDFGVRQEQVSKIKRRLSWRHI